MLEFLFFVLAKILESNNVAEDEIRKNEAIQKEAAITSLAAFFLVKNTDFFSDCTLKILPKIPKYSQQNIPQIKRKCNEMKKLVKQY